MYAAFALAIMSLLAILGTNLSAVQYQIVQHMDANRKQQVFTETVGAVRDYFDKHLAYPDTLEDLASTEGFEFISAYTDYEWLLYNRSNAIDDGPWRFRRVAVVVQDPSRAIMPASNYWLSINNTCGTGSFDTSASWCGQESSLWWKDEEREHIIAHAIEIKRNMNRTISKISRFYNKNGVMPSLYSGGSTLADGATASLTSMTGFGGSRDTCHGSHVFGSDGSIEGVPLDCSDMFSTNGNSIRYTKINDNKAALTVDSGFDKAGGGALVVGAHISIDI